MPEHIHWPTTFTEIRSNPPPGYSVSEIVVDPQIYITRAENCFVAEVVGVVRGGNRVPVPIKGSNYIVDGTKIRPLPRDVNDFFRKTLIKRSAENRHHRRQLLLQPATKRSEVHIPPSR